MAAQIVRPSWAALIRSQSAMVTDGLKAKIIPFGTKCTLPKLLPRSSVSKNPAKTNVVTCAKTTIMCTAGTGLTRTQSATVATSTLTSTRWKNKRSETVPCVSQQRPTATPVTLTGPSYALGVIQATTLKRQKCEASSPSQSQPSASSVRCRATASAVMLLAALSVQRATYL
jgi:hypothetical protein